MSVWKVIGLYLATSLMAAALAAGERIEISAEDGESDLANNSTRLMGEVHIRQGATEIWGDEAVFYGTEASPQRVELTGDPGRWKTRLEDGSQVQGHSERIEYDFAANVVHFVGSAHVEGPQGTFTGDRLTYDMTDERLRGRGGEGGRFQIVIEPDALPTPEDEPADGSPTGNGNTEDNGDNGE